MAGKPPQSNLQKRRVNQPSEKRPAKKDRNFRGISHESPEKKEKDFLLEKLALTSPDIFFILNFPKKKIDSLLSSLKEPTSELFEPSVRGKEEDFLSQITDEDLNELWKGIEDYSASKNRDVGEREIRRLDQDGGIKHFLIRFTPFRRNESNEIVEWFCQARDISESKEQLKEIRDNKMKLQMALDGSGMGIWSYEPFTQNFDLDSRSCKILGLDDINFTGDIQQVLAKVHPEDREFAIDTAINALKGKGRFNHELRIIHPHSAAVTHVAVIGELVINEQAEISKITGICIDITKNKLVENKIETNEALLGELQRIAKIGCFDWDLELNKVNLSTQMYSILGVSSEAPLSLDSFYAKVIPQDRHDVEQTLMDTIKSGGRLSKDFQYTSPKGVKKILWAQGQASMNSKNRTTRLVGTIQDISEKKEKELNTQNIIIRSILHYLPVIIQIVEKNGTIKSLLGEVGLRRIGMVENQTLGENIFKQDSKTAKEIRKVLKGETVNFTEKVVHNGRTLHLLSYYFYEPERELAIGFSLDITAQKQTEAAFQEVSAKNRELERMNQVMDMFVYATAHDLKNPINNLEMLSLLLNEASSKEEQQEYYKALSKSIQRLKFTIQGLTEIIQVESQRELNSGKLIFKEVLQHILADLDPMLKEKNGKIITSFKKGSIQYNKAFLTSILKNLLSNSIKYSHQGRSPIITIKTEKRNDYILLSVEDNGIGIDLPQNQQNLFKPFKRFTNQAVGSGIGLHLIKSMVEKNGGYLEVESTPGKGTTFNCFLVPFQKEDETSSIDESKV